MVRGRPTAPLVDQGELVTDHDLLVLRTEALNRVAKKLGQVREMAVDAKYRRGLVDADDILLITDRRHRP